ncbi:FecR domain-containing protein [Nostocaceae cyanobacterium CENA369]|uniref:FecR domain-containing protein n=1 Tax=Dendronalium phyllosphericum CENA369 TaxID=1725256 RepID=A0A8J7I7X5_9NOST|nr:FecR family protein [Dendronalium phyllosphericum]MBH8574107.1 FecR domain-containing protein [Dendronalium phyllosphericum CENA369]
MFLKLFPLWLIGLWGMIILPLPNRANAIAPLTRAEIQNLRNLVQLIPKNSKKRRPARKLDPMIPGDGLSTGRSSLADLRFNDGSLARLGEQAIFKFLPKTRYFTLSNGTILLLIPPGRGQTRIQTPSAAAAIRGSALFVRYDKQTDTTIVGALTNSGIEVFNKEASQNQVLQAGQLIVIVKGEFQGLFDFDLRNFYETSDLVRGLDLTRQNPTATIDPAIASVQDEIAAAVAAQSPIIGKDVIDNPSFLQLSTSSSNSASKDVLTNNSSADTINDSSSLNTFVETGEILYNTARRTVNDDNYSKTPINSPTNSSHTNGIITPIKTDNDLPQLKPQQPPTQPEQPPTQPQQPPTQPEKPPTQPEQPPTQPEKLPTQPEQPPTQPEKPPTQPEKPPTQPEQPSSPAP